jgi:Asp-tRNA(Asn)/Glu-tRNA(Gln) amidotransferase A subunit family amidase
MAALVATVAVQPALAQQAFDPMEATITSIHEALTAGEVTCVSVIQAFLDRIEAYDQVGPTLNSIQNINPAALEEAAAIDAALAGGAELDKLTCIPAVVKDQIETNFIPTTYGSVLFKDFVPERNATIVERLMDAGAIVIAKTNMGEFAGGGSGSAFGECHNAYNPLYYASGSSCGTGIAITANFGVIGIGEDTAGSLRGPASHGNLYGLRPTMGLISVFGVMPQAPTRDTLGPISRTVEDAAIVMDVIAGYDPKNPITGAAVGNIPETYTAALDPNLEGLRFAVIRSPLVEGTDTSAPDYLEIQEMISHTVDGLEEAGAEVINLPEIPGLVEMIAASAYGFEVEDATNAYLAELTNSPFKTWAEITADPRIHEDRRGISRSVGHSIAGDPAFAEALRARVDLRIRVLDVMAANDLDGLIYAPFDRAPPLLPGSTEGNNRLMATYLGYPSIVIPAGLNAEGIPIGVEILGRPFEELTLLHAAYGYEQAANPRVLPPTVPPL